MQTEREKQSSHQNKRGRKWYCTEIRRMSARTSSVIAGTSWLIYQYYQYCTIGHLASLCLQYFQNLVNTRGNCWPSQATPLNSLIPSGQAFSPSNVPWDPSSARHVPWSSGTCQIFELNKVNTSWCSIKAGFKVGISWIQDTSWKKYNRIAAWPLLSGIIWNNGRWNGHGLILISCLALLNHEACICVGNRSPACRLDWQDCATMGVSMRYDVLGFFEETTSIRWSKNYSNLLERSCTQERKLPLPTSFRCF